MLFQCSSLLGQQSRFSIEKRQCSLGSNQGYKLILHFDSASLHVVSFPYNYDLGYFIDQPDSVKLLLIGQLLKYENDTDQCCLNVVAHLYNGIAGCSSPELQSKHYGIQIDALYMINRLCWPKLMELYSCYTALYDTASSVDINEDPVKIGLVVKEYRAWYETCKRRGKISPYFPFNDGPYIWAGGRKSIDPKDE
jgi:hypothetical protein